MNGISGVHSQSYLHRQISTVQTPATEAGKPATNPAQSARAALVTRSDLAAKPFGSIVSLFAKGLPLPPMETAPGTTTDAGTETAPADVSAV